MLMTLVSLHSWDSIYLGIEGALVTHKGDDTRVFGPLGHLTFLRGILYMGLGGM